MNPRLVLPWSDRLLLIALVFGLSCGALDSHAQIRFEGEGRVVAVDERQGSVTLDHGPIPGLAPAMRTEFPVEHVELLRKARIGEVVRFSLATNEDSHGILTLSSLDPLPRGSAGALRPIASARLAEVPLWVPLTMWAFLLAVGGSVGYALWRMLREIKKVLGAAANAHEELRGDLQLIVHTMVEIAVAVGKGLQRQIEVQAARSRNGRAGEIARGRRSSLIVVRQGELDLFQTLQERLDDDGLTHVIWDRRIGERRTGQRVVRTECRRGDRRGPPPRIWTTLGFILVPPETGHGIAEPRQSPR